MAAQQRLPDWEAFITASDRVEEEPLRGTATIPDDLAIMVGETKQLEGEPSSAAIEHQQIRQRLQQSQQQSQQFWQESQHRSQRRSQESQRFWRQSEQQRQQQFQQSQQFWQQSRQRYQQRFRESQQRFRQSQQRFRQSQQQLQQQFQQFQQSQQLRPQSRQRVQQSRQRVQRNWQQSQKIRQRFHQRHQQNEQRLQQLRQDLRREFQRPHDEIQQMHQQPTAVNTNTAARVVNFPLQTSYDPWAPLANAETNKEIKGIPVDSVALAQLSWWESRKLGRELGMNVPARNVNRTTRARFLAQLRSVVGWNPFQQHNPHTTWQGEEDRPRTH